MTNFYVHSPSSSECECAMYDCYLKTIDFKRYHADIAIKLAATI